MANKLTRKKPNRLLTGRNNYYSFGSFMNNVMGNPENGKLTTGAFKGMSTEAAAGLQAAGTVVGQLGGGLIGGGLQSGAGNALQGLSGIASAIPGPWGGIASAGLGLLGGLTNRAFGSKMNTENIAKVEANINNLNNFQSNASDFDTLSNNWANADVGMTFNDSFIGKDGWFSNKAKNKAADLRRQIEAGNVWVQNTLNNNAQNISTTQMQNLLTNYAALGGRINRFDDGGYTWQDGAKDVASFLPLVGTAMDAYELYENPSWENAGYLGLSVLSEIPFLKWIKGAKIASRAAKAVDKATDAASSYQKAAQKVARMESKGTLNPKVVNRAKGTRGSLFFDNQVAQREARQATMRLDGQRVLERATTYPLLFGDALANEHQIIMNRKAFGGELGTNGADFTNGIIQINSGGIHEQNPNEGVIFGMDQDGIPNLVEEGEVIFNDYVFSNRLKVPKAVRNKYKLRGNKSLTFADAALQMSKESEERPNDPISQAGLENSLMKLMMEQEQIRTRRGKTNTFSKGGKMGRVYAGEQDDPYSQLLALGMRPVNPSSAWALGAPQTETPSSPKNEMSVVLGGYTSNPTVIKPGESTISEIIKTQQTKYPTPVVDANDKDVPSKPSMSPTWLRYVPAFASGAMSITDSLGLTNKPDYGEAEAVLEAARGAGTYNPIKFKPVGNYLTYRPFDRDYYINKLNAESSAARRAIFNTSGGNRAQAMAGILSADYNAQGKMGDLFRQAEEYNLAQKQKVEDFNRATDMFNSKGILEADQHNLNAQLQARSSYLKGALTAAELRQKERQASVAARSANLSNFINSLGDIGRENFSRNMIVSDPSKYYTIGSNGEISYKSPFYDLSEAEQDYITGHATRKSKSKSESKANGGYLTIKRK